MYKKEPKKKMAKAKRRIKKICHYLSSGDAAKFLGVTKTTLKNWDISGKLIAKRNPVNGFKLYKFDDLDALLNQLANSDSPRSK